MSPGGQVPESFPPGHRAGVVAGQDADGGAAGLGGDRVPVIAIDGPAASGKGTLASGLAALLGFHCLDSGLLYRAVALAALRAGQDLADQAGVAAIARAVALDDATAAGATASHPRLPAAGDGAELRGEACGRAASIVAAHPAVRATLLAWQRRFRRPPGLVADGRDMGTVVFPDAVLKIFLMADAEERARRRHLQLRVQEGTGIISDCADDIESRDERDRNRGAAPLRPAADAMAIETTAKSREEVLAEVAGLARQRLGLGLG